MHLQTIRQYQICRIVRSAAVGAHAGTYVIFLQSLGFNLFHVTIVNFCFMVTSALLEVPTGIFADKFGRKKSFVLGFGISALGFGLYALSINITHAIISEIIIAVGFSFISGAMEAWLISEHDGREGYDIHDNLQTVFSTTNTVTASASILLGILGSMLAEYNLRIPMVLGAVIMLLGWSYAWYVTSEIKNNFGQHQSAWNISKKSWCTIKSTPALRTVTIIMAISTLAFQAFNMFWQPFSREMLEVGQLGYVWMGIQITALIGAWAVRFVPDKHALPGLMVCVLLTFIPCATIHQVGYTFLGLVLFLIHEIPRGTLNTLRQTIIQTAIPDESLRASVTSTESMIVTLGAAFGLLTCGLVAENTSILTTWFAYALLPIAACIILIFKK